MKQFEQLSHPADGSEKQPNISAENRDSYLPLITSDESRLIETSGGEYRGFVERPDRSRGFEDIFVDHHTYYDEANRSLVEAFVATEAVNDEGGNELEKPGDVVGFSTIITRTLRSGEALVPPQIISISSRELPAQNQSRLRDIAHETHRYVVGHVARLKPAELERQAKAMLLFLSQQRRKF